MRLRFILIFGNKLIHSYNHDFNYHPNLQHRTIHSTIYSDDWLVNTVIMLLIIIGGIGFLVWDDLSVKNETAEKTGVDYVEMGMQRVMDRYGVVKKRDSVLLTD